MNRSWIVEKYMWMLNIILPCSSSTWGRRGGFHREQTPGPVQVAVQWRHSPPSGPHGSTPLRKLSSSLQSLLESSSLLALQHLLFTYGMCVRVWVGGCGCVKLYVCMHVQEKMWDDFHIYCSQLVHAWTQLCTFQKFDCQCVRGFPFLSSRCYVFLAGWGSHIHRECTFVHLAIVPLSQFGSNFEVAA